MLLLSVENASMRLEAGVRDVHQYARFVEQNILEPVAGRIPGGAGRLLFSVVGTG